MHPEDCGLWKLSGTLSARQCLVKVLTMSQVVPATTRSALAPNVASDPRRRRSRRSVGVALDGITILFSIVGPLDLKALGGVCCRLCEKEGNMRRRKFLKTLLGGGVVVGATQLVNAPIANA